MNDPTQQLRHDWGLIAFWKYADHTVGGVLPVTNNQHIGRLRGDANGLSIIAGDFKSGTVVEEYPMALLAFGDSPGEVRDRLFEAAQTISPRLTLRKSKDKIPKPFDTLGWCSWNAFGAAVTEKDVRHAVDVLKEREVPVRYMLLDDGWLHHDSASVEKAGAEGFTRNRLLSYDPDPEKFPSGLHELVEYAKANGIPSFGIWHTLNGYWAGISPKSQMLKEHPDDFFHSPEDAVLPEPGHDFYRRWYNLMRKWGIGFVKVDNQGFHRQTLPYIRNLPSYVAGLQKDLQTAAKEAGFPIIHCMAAHSELIFNSFSPQLLRITNDFCPNDDFSARLHLVNNFYSAFWLGKVFWTDFDMFQSGDRHAEAFARMLSLSHSPICTTDLPETINTSLIKRLALPSGDVPRFEAPGEPLEDRFFANPYDNNNALTVAARSHGITTVGVFNTCEAGLATATQISPSDLGYDSPCFVYSDGGGINSQILLVDQPILISLKGLQSDLLTFSPVKNGFAPIGVTDYYAAPALLAKAPVKVRDTWRLNLRSGGMLVAYSMKQPKSISADGRILERASSGELKEESWHWENGLLRVRSAARSLKIRTA